MTRKHLTVLVLILILSTLATSALTTSTLGTTALAANFMPPTTTQGLPPGWHALTAVLPAYSGFDDVAISPDSQYAVFIADIDVDDQDELYSVPLTGTTPVKLNPPLVSGGEILYFIITADSSRVIYWGEQDVDQRRELYSVPIQGGTATKLNGPLPTGGNVQSFQADADTGQVLYTADQDTNDVYELYSVPVEGGAFVKLNPLLTSGGNVFIFKIDPVSDRVVYSADQDTDQLYELYSVPITGGVAVKLNLPVSAGIYSEFEITPGAATVMFIAKATGANAYQLYINDTAGGVVQRRSHNLNPGENVLNFKISPDGSQVVYVVTPNNQSGPGNLYQTSPFSGDAHVLTVAEPGFGVDYYDFVFTPDGERIVCIYQYDATTPKKLMSVKTTGFPVIQADLYVPDSDHAVGIYRISLDSQWVVYQEYTPSLDSTLRAVPTIGGATVYFGPGTNTNWAITPDSQRVIYASPPDDYPRDLVSTQIFGGGLLNLSRLDGFDIVYSPQISPNGQWIVFAVQLLNGNGETIGTQLRVSDGTEAPEVPPTFNTYLPLVEK